jgi:DNA primase
VAADTLDRAAAWYAQQLQAAPPTSMRARRTRHRPASIDKFGLGFAPPKRALRRAAPAPKRWPPPGCWSKTAQRRLARLLPQPDDDSGRRRAAASVGFAGRIHGDGEPKYINSPESDHFAKGDLLFNLHRAAPAARSARRLIIVEGQLDTIALDQAGIAEAVAPMGTALTERQLERAWRVAHCPVLLFDGDAAGRKAALRAAERAMPHVGPGKSLAIAQLPDGEDPDSLAHRSGDRRGRAARRMAVRHALLARPRHDLVDRKWAKGVVDWTEGDTAFVSVVFSWDVDEALRASPGMASGRL